MVIVYPPEPWLHDAMNPLLAAYSIIKLALQRRKPILQLPEQVVHRAEARMSFLQVPLEQRQVLAQDGDVRMAHKARQHIDVHPVAQAAERKGAPEGVAGAVYAWTRANRPGTRMRISKMTG